MCYAQILSERITQARKTHRCEECGTTVHPGTKYHSWSGIGDGGFQYVKMCLRCKNLWKQMWDRYSDDLRYACIEIGQVREYLQEQAHNKRDWQRRGRDYDRWQDLDPDAKAVYRVAGEQKFSDWWSGGPCPE